MGAEADPLSGTALADADFKPEFHQKGVYMRIGLDMANYAANRSVRLLALVTNDTDCIPAMKYARRAGLQVALVCVPGYEPTHELLAHCDFRRAAAAPQIQTMAASPPHFLPVRSRDSAHAKTARA